MKTATRAMIAVVVLGTLFEELRLLLAPSKRRMGDPLSFPTLDGTIVLALAVICAVSTILAYRAIANEPDEMRANALSRLRWIRWSILAILLVETEQIISWTFNISIFLTETRLRG